MKHNELFLLNFLFSYSGEFYEKCVFLAKGCVMEQISRKKTKLKIQFYFQSIITKPIQTFLKLGKGIGLILL